MLPPDELAIARTVIYASLFDYPLTPDQVQQTLIESDQTLDGILSTFAASESLQAILDYQDGFFFPAGQGGLIAERRVREARSRAFLAKHRRLLALICALPYTRLVALSGSIAHLNLDSGGDLDLFIVASRGHVWSVTVAVLLLAKLLRCRPAICANFIIADSRLRIEQQELFTANQVIHLKPLVGERVFQDLLDANPFIRDFYPNFRARASVHTFQPGRPPLRLKAALERLLLLPSRAAEALCRFAYGRHLRRRASSWRSGAQVRLEPDYLKLHSHSHRQSILERFDNAVSDAQRRAEFTRAAAVGK